MAFQFIGKQDVYLEIANKYESYITNGLYKVGDKLPSVRAVAAELGVNPNTVQRAYSLLEERGFIRSMPKKGAFVIYGRDENEASSIRSEAVGVVVRLKEMGASREELLSIIEEVYGND